MKKIDLQIPWTKIFVEFFSVVFAIFLALLVDEWKDDRDNRKQAQQAVNNITSEIRKNYDSLIVYHSSFSRRNNALDSLIKLAKSNTPFAFKGYQFMTLTNTAWESAKLTRVVNYIDFKTLSELSEIYNAQMLYTNIVQRVIDDMIFSSNISTLEEAAVLLQKHKNLFLSIDKIEGQLVDSYRKYLDNNIRSN